jgi:hypothetical protein
MKRFLLIFFLCCSFSEAWSDELFEMYRPARAMGMGGILTIFPRDTDAVILNPAYMRWNEGLSWEIFGIDVGGDGNSYDIYKYTKNGGTFTSASDFDQLFGKPIWVNGFGKTSIALPYFGFAIYSGTQINTEFRNPAYPKFNMSYLSDHGTAVGFAVPIGPFSSLGLSVKRIARWGTSKNLSLGTIASGNTSTILDEFQNKGTGYGIDGAWMSKLDGPFQPTFTAVWQDIGSTAFTKTAGATAPPQIKDNLTFGIGSKLDLPGLDIITGFEYRHVTLQGEQLGKKLHFGTEISLPMIDLRAGVNQGYGSYGAAVDLWFLNLDAAMWTEELGVYPGQTPQKRYLVTLSMQLSFDPNFNLNDTSGRRRKLKQRR